MIIIAFSKKLINNIKTKVNIVDLANEYFDVTKKNGYLGIKNGASQNGDFSSIVIYPATNSFFRNSNRHGGDVINFVIETQIEGINNFTDAVNFLKNKIDPNFKIEQQYQKKKLYSDLSREEKINKIKDSHESLLKNLKKDSNNRNVIAYLLNTRKIDKAIVYNELNKKRICQAITPNGSKAVAFIGYNYGLFSAVSFRGISSNSKFKGDLKGCNYDIGWRIYPEQDNKKVIFEDSKVYCFEGYIDMLSYMSLEKQKGNNHDKDIFIACGSTNKYKCVENFYIENKSKNDLVICFDNDQAGKELGNILEKSIKDLKLGNNITKEFSYFKDWNEDLIEISKKKLSLSQRKNIAVEKSKKMTIKEKIKTETKDNTSIKGKNLELG